ncbi:MAG TPA: hypothetical protein ENK82_02875 [Campylobacterales bacterium]|nr:hypothetical protein [Campylobacterales bacterium]HHS92264.1 hypothetical protein [Campylobacterales bacterium]
MNSELKEKLSKVVELVDNNLANPDVELNYFIPGVTVDETVYSGEPYIELKCLVRETHKQGQKIPLKENYLSKTPEDIANLVTFYIEQFMEQIESVEGGAQ